MARILALQQLSEEAETNERCISLTFSSISIVAL
jgi:hypothetical protein